MVTLGEIGIARGHPVGTSTRPAGDAVSRYGMGPTLVRVPFLLARRAVGRAFGLGSSQTLFVLSNILLILGAAAAAGVAGAGLGRRRRRAAGDPRDCARVAALGVRRLRLLGASSGRSRRAACSPPAVRSAIPGSPRGGLSFWAAAAGALAGIGAPLEVDLHRPRSVRPRSRGLGRAGRVAAPPGARGGGRCPPFARSGSPSRSSVSGGRSPRTEGEHFNHPCLDGLWRLTVGAEQGTSPLLSSRPLAVPGLRRVFAA